MKPAVQVIIIVAVIATGAVLLFPDSIRQVIDSNKVTDSVNEDVNDFKKEVGKVQDDISSTMEGIGGKIDDIKSKTTKIFTGDLGQASVSAEEPVFYGHVYDKNQNGECLISVPDLAQIINGKRELTRIITIDDCQFEIDEPVWVIEVEEGGIIEEDDQSGVTISSSVTKSKNNLSVKPIPQSQVFETLQLKTTQQQDGDVMIQYEDTSGKTLSVTVTLRNSEKELFTGIFYTSKFETFVNDVSNDPHIIEMVVDHAEHGLITSSVYKPAGNYDTMISGVFTKK